MSGVKFRRQVPVDRFIVDFLCEEYRLIVELDGGQHAKSADVDALRPKIMKSHGYRIIRFRNNDVLSNIDGVLQAIDMALNRGI